MLFDITRLIICIFLGLISSSYRKFKQLRRQEIQFTISRTFTLSLKLFSFIVNHIYSFDRLIHVEFNKS